MARKAKKSNWNQFDLPFEQINGQFVPLRFTNSQVRFLRAKRDRNFKKETRKPLWKFAISIQLISAELLSDRYYRLI